MIQGKVLPATFPRINCYRLLELTNKQDKCQIVIVIYNGNCNLLFLVYNLLIQIIDDE